MKTKIAALTLVLFAGCATAALAQDRDRGERRGEARAEHPAAPVPRAAPDFQRERPAPSFQPRSEPARAAPQPAPQAQPERRSEGGGRFEGFRRGGEGREGFSRGGGGTVGQAPTPAPDATAERQPRGDGDRGRWQGRGGQDRGDQARNGQARDGQGRGGWDGQRHDGGDRSRDGDRGRWNGRDGDRHDGDRGDRNRGDRNGDGRWDGNRHDGDRHDGDRHDGDRRDGRWNGRDWNRDDHGRPHWDHNRYPPVYRSHHRYRHVWRPPIGFYVRSWGYGDILPFGWYAPEYRLLDWWTYDLPAPPPGYDWVRVGYDALLIDEFDGRVMQVVRLVFY